MDDYTRLSIIETVLERYYDEVDNSNDWYTGDEADDKSLRENINRALAATRAMLNRKRPK